MSLEKKVQDLRVLASLEMDLFITWVMEAAPGLDPDEVVDRVGGLVGRVIEAAVASGQYDLAQRIPGALRAAIAQVAIEQKAKREEQA